MCACETTANKPKTKRKQNCITFIGFSMLVFVDIFYLNIRVSWIKVHLFCSFISNSEEICILKFQTHRILKNYAKLNVESHLIVAYLR